MGLQNQKKEEKRLALLDAAESLFKERGPQKTSVSDIADRARVAKGTFYLYFRDKDAVLRALFNRISYRLLNDAYAYVQTQNCTTFPDKVIALVDYIIEYFKHDKLVLMLLQRNLSWPDMSYELKTNHDSLYARAVQIVRESSDCTLSEDEIMKRISIFVAMCGSSCYSSIIEGKPYPIDEMKPVLYDIIRKSL